MFYEPNWSWTTLDKAKLPNAMVNHASLTVNNRVFIFGKKIFELNIVIYRVDVLHSTLGNSYFYPSEYFSLSASFYSN